MYKTQRMLLALLACICTPTLQAQTRVDIVISRLEKPLEDNVRLFLSIEQQKDHALMSVARLRRLHKKAPQEIAKALQPFGYYRPLVTSDLSQISPDNWQASYIIDPGPALRIGQFNFSISEEMSRDPEFQALIQKFPLHKGDIFNHIGLQHVHADRP